MGELSHRIGGMRRHYHGDWRAERLHPRAGHSSRVSLVVGGAMHECRYYSAHGGDVWCECVSAYHTQRVGSDALDGRPFFKLVGGAGIIQGR